MAGRYHVTKYMGSAAFSKTIQAHDLHTEMDVCMKIIKNNKDFFHQSPGGIKLLKYINKLRGLRFDLEEDHSPGSSIEKPANCQGLWRWLGFFKFY